MNRIFLFIILSVATLACKQNASNAENPDERKKLVKARISELSKKESKTQEDKEAIAAAYEELAGLTEADSNKVKLYVQSAKQYQEIGNETKAIALFDRVISTYPKERLTGDALAGKAMHFDNKNQNDSALAYYERLVLSFPDHELSADAAQRIKDLRPDKVGIMGY